MTLRSSLRIVAAIAAVSVMAVGCAASVETFPGTEIQFRTSGGSSSTAASCATYASSLSALVEVSDKVVVAKVTSAEPAFAATYGSEQPQTGIQPETGAFLNRNLELQVERVLSDRGQRELTGVEAWGWSLAEDKVWQPFEINDNQRVDVGDRAIFPLVVPPGDGLSELHGVLCTGAFVLQDGKVLPKKPAEPRLLEFGKEGAENISAYEMTEQQLTDVLADLSREQGVMPDG